MIETGKQYKYEIRDKRVAYPTKGICEIEKIEKVKVNGLFRKGDTVVYFEGIKDDGSKLPSIRMSTYDVSFEEIKEVTVSLDELSIKLIESGGSIRSSNDFSDEELRIARKQRRFAVNGDGFGFVYQNTEQIKKSLAKYKFVDELGHPLESCIEYQKL